MLFDVRRRVQHVMMIVLKDADIQEAERVGEKDRQTRREDGQIRPGRHFDFQHHDRDDDGHRA